MGGHSRDMILPMKQLCLSLLLSFTVVVLGCNGSGDGDSESFFSQSSGAFAPAAAPESEIAVFDDSDDFDEAAEFQEEAMIDAVMARTVVAAAEAPAALPQASGDLERAAVRDESGESLPGGDTVNLDQERRIIVRTVDMGIVVNDVAETVDAIGDVAEEIGGWLVSSSRAEEHRGFVSIRVPAESLEEAIMRLRGMAQEVKTEITSSRDVTDEYYDFQARLTNLEATEGALIKLLDRAEKVEDALSIQQSLSGVQEDIERIQGRIKLLEQTSAFSLINVSLELVKGMMAIDAGADTTAAVDEPVRFRATFTPPTDVEEFTFTWDFGDGSSPITSNRTAPTEKGSQRVTATVTHVYADERDSPYIAQIKITGIGEAGEFEGEDTLIVTVSRAPVIEVFFGEGFSTEAGETVQLSGSFTRPSEVRDVQYVWDFGDGSDPKIGSVGEGVTTVVASHTYQNHRPHPYEVRLTIRAQSDAGPVEIWSVAPVFVEQPLGWTVGGWDIDDQVKGAVRSLSDVGLGLATVGIWLAIFSPIWIGAVIVAVVVVRRRKARSVQHADVTSDSDQAGDA